MCTCMNEYMYVCMYAYMYVCMHACMYGMYVCMYIFRLNISEHMAYKKAYCMSGLEYLAIVKYLVEYVYVYVLLVCFQ